MTLTSSRMVDIQGTLEKCDQVPERTVKRCPRVRYWMDTLNSPTKCSLRGSPTVGHT